MIHAYTLSVFTENSPGILHRISVILTRRKINIESLTVSETERKGISRFTIVIRCDAGTVEKVVKQIERIIEVSEAYYSEDEDLLFKEIAFLKVNTGSSKDRAEIEEQALRYGAEIIYAEPGFLVLEKTGTEDEINSLNLLLEPFGIKEFVRSGRIAIDKHEHRRHSKFEVEQQEIIEQRTKL